MILEAYFDESGTNSADPALVLAGLMSTPENWRDFSVEWQELLDEWNVRHFHMSEFEAGYGPYQGWRAGGVHQERLEILLTLICKYAISSLAVGVSEERFREVFGPSAKSDLKYAIAARALFWQMSKFDRDGNPLVFYDIDADRFAFVFEAGARGIGQMQRVFQRYYNQPLQRMVFRLVSLTYVGKEGYQPLQAADILAYELFKHFARQYGSDAPSVRYPLQRLSTLPHIYSNVSVSDMELWKPDFLLAIEEGRI